jgi:hypothetical protein
MSAAKPITGLSPPLTSVLPAARTPQLPTCVPLMNPLVVRHVRKGFLKDISLSRPYDNTTQPAKHFSSRREEQNGFRL